MLQHWFVFVSLLIMTASKMILIGMCSCFIMNFYGRVVEMHALLSKWHKWVFS